ncbi:MAG: hypothetical protein WCX63_07000, partial [Methanoregula sp.]
AVEDFIAVDVAVADKRICELVGASWKPGIADEVRAREFSLHLAGESGTSTYQLVKDWDVEGVAMTIGISKAV